MLEKHTISSWQNLETEILLFTIKKKKKENKLPVQYKTMSNLK